MESKSLTELQKAILARVTSEWRTPGMIGAHASSLKALARRGLIESRINTGVRERWGDQYRSLRGK